MEGSEVIGSDEWQLAEWKRQLVEMARDNEHDKVQFEILEDRIAALTELMHSEPNKI